jgi:tRNA-dihydrouridine synthase B
MYEDMNNFWKKLDKGFLVMAPMAGITDLPFRQICKEFGADVLYSEMASATALYYDQNVKKKEKISPTLDLLKFENLEKPFVTQIFGSDPKHFEVATKIITKKIKPQGIDINLGCPVKKVIKQGAGSALMRDFKKSKEVIKAVMANTNLPVSIKTRTQVGDKNILDFLDYISDLDLKAIMVHGRTFSQGFSGEIDFNILKNIKNYFGGIYIVNGFYLESGQNNSLEIGKYYENLLNKIEADGLGIGRIALGRPWVFKEIKNYFNKQNSFDVDKDMLKKIILKHLKSVQEFYGEKGLFEMRKHIAWYTKGIKNSAVIRQEIFKVDNFQAMFKIINQI